MEMGTRSLGKLEYKNRMVIDSEAKTKWLEFMARKQKCL